MAPLSADDEAEDDRRGRVLAAVRAIPPGQVAGYGVVARRAGLPRAARYVARVLAQADDPALPWHRVVRSDGRIAFPPQSPAWQRQVALLEAEGVELCNGRVRIAVDAGAALDRALWGGADD